MAPRRGTLVADAVDSRVLRGNPLGDPSERELYVYLPPGYGAGRRRYPVVLLIVGFTGIAANPWQHGYFGEALQDRLDRLIAARRIPPMIVATPDCVTSLGGSQYVDSPAVGRYESFCVKEVVPHLDAGYRTKPAARHRAVCGKSSGGYGALMLGMRHPDVFGSLASHSGDAYFDYCYRGDFPTAWNTVRAAGGPERWLRAFRKRRATKPAGSDVHTLNILAMAACYSPNADAPLGFDLPFDLDTGEERADVMRRWRARDPVVACRRYARNLKRLRGIFIDCGLRDEWHLHIGARILSRRLTELGVRHVHEEFDDTHRSISYRYDASFPHLGRWTA